MNSLSKELRRARCLSSFFYLAFSFFSFSSFSFSFSLFLLSLGLSFDESSSSLLYIEMCFWLIDICSYGVFCFSRSNLHSLKDFYRSSFSEWLAGLGRRCFSLVDPFSDFWEIFLASSLILWASAPSWLNVTASLISLTILSRLLMPLSIVLMNSMFCLTFSE